MAEKTTEETTGGKYLTKDYLVRNLKTFWGKIKAYIEQQTQLLSSFIGGQIDLKADQTDLDSLRSLVDNKANNLDLETLQQTVAGKVDKEGDKVLSDKNFTDTYETKLKGIEDNANNYTLPAASGSTLGGVKTTSRVNSPDGLDACPIIDGVPYYKDTTYSIATTNQPGLLSASDKAKLDNITDETYKQITANLINIHNAEDNNGGFNLDFSSDFKHLKMYLYYRDDFKCIEKFAIRNSRGSVLFGSSTIDISNPDGETIVEFADYSFYVEYLEMANGEKYRPFILSVHREYDSTLDIYSFSKDVGLLS